MAEQVERVGVGLLGGLGQLVEVDAALLERLDDLGALLGIGPCGAQLRRGRAERADLLGGVVGVADDAELLAVRVELVDQVRGDLDLAAVEVELAALARSAARRSSDRPSSARRLVRRRARLVTTSIVAVRRRSLPR